MDNLMEAVKAMPKMLSGKALASALTILPKYDENIRKENEAVRLVELSDLYSIYLPSQMTFEIYSKLYLSLLRSLQNKKESYSLSLNCSLYTFSNSFESSITFSTILSVEAH